jgi:hypothetical protein
MAAEGKYVSREFRTDAPPEQVIRDFVLKSPRSSGSGYKIESQMPDAVVLVRRFTSWETWGIPLIFAALCLAASARADSISQAHTYGSVALVLVIAAGVLALVVKKTERLAVSARADADGTTHVVIDGRAAMLMHNYILGLGDA